MRPGLVGDDPVTVHHSGEFTGEVNVLAGRRALVRATMREPGDVLWLDQEALRDVSCKATRS